MRVFRFSALSTSVATMSLLTGSPAPAQTAGPIVDGLSRHQVEALCSPTRETSSAVLARIAGSRDNAKQHQYSVNDVLVIDAGTSSGLGVGQQLIVQRPFPAPSMTVDSPAPVVGEHVAGWLRVTRVEADWAEAQVVYQCGEFWRGDELRAFERPTIVEPVTGSPQFDRAATVVFGDEGRASGGPTQLMVIDQGSNANLRMGQRVTVFRRAAGASGPLSTVGEATIVAIAADSATIRLDSTRDAVHIGDSAAPHSAR